jgi:predicted transcriptional regulator
VNLHSLADWRIVVPDLKYDGIDERGTCPVCNKRTFHIRRYSEQDGEAICETCTKNVLELVATRIFDAMEGQAEGRGLNGATPRSPPEPRRAPRQKNEKPQLIIPRPKGFTAGGIAKMELEPVRYAVPGYICEGLNILAGGQKMGKSWLALQIALAVAQGGKAMSAIDVEAGTVLYIALEDGLRRLQERLLLVLGESAAPENLWFFTEWPPASAGGLVLLDEWLTQHPETRLAVIDTMGRFRGERARNGDIFQQDYDFGARLKALADKHHTALLILHHLAKRQSDDPFEKVSGTVALTAAADATLLLDRRRGEDDARLLVTGRDVEDRDMGLEWCREMCCWRLLGHAAETKQSRERQAICDVLRMNGAMTPKAVAKALGKNYHTTKNLMRHMAEKGVLLVEGGFYTVVSLGPQAQENDEEGH